MGGTCCVKIRWNGVSAKILKFTIIYIIKQIPYTHYTSHTLKPSSRIQYLNFLNDMISPCDMICIGMTLVISFK